MLHCCSYDPFSDFACVIEQAIKLSIVAWRRAGENYFYVEGVESGQRG